MHIIPNITELHYTPAHGLGTVTQATNQKQSSVARTWTKIAFWIVDKRSTNNLIFFCSIQKTLVRKCWKASCLLFCFCRDCKVSGFIKCSLFAIWYNFHTKISLLHSNIPYFQMQKEIRCSLFILSLITEFKDIFNRISVSSQCRRPLRFQGFIQSYF